MSPRGVGQLWSNTSGFAWSLVLISVGFQFLILEITVQGAWGAQSMKRPPLDFCSGDDLRSWD